MKNFISTIVLCFAGLCGCVLDLSAQEYLPQRDESGKYGYKMGAIWMIEPRFDNARKFSEGLAPVSIGGKCGYISKDGNMVIPFRFETAHPFKEGLAAVLLNGKFGYIDNTGKSVIPYRFENAGDFSEGLAPAMLNGKYGYIDRSGKSAIPYKYDDALLFNYGIAKVRIDGKDGYIDKSGKWFDNAAEIYSSFSGFARQYVEPKVNIWQKKGKYEKTVHWQQRVNENTRQVLIDSLVQEARTEYIAAQAKGINTEQVLGDYDADGEIFMVHDSRFGMLLLPVPISEAEAFEKSFSRCSRMPEYFIQDDGIALAAETWTTPDGKRYSYSNDRSLEFAMADIKYNFDPIELELDEDAAPSGSQQISRKSISIGKSDVDINIPQSRVRNDKTFAVIIANEDYQRESPVQFALNDGSTFAEYCNHALGIPEENIHLVKNATLNNILAEVDWITKVADAYNGEAGIIFYYAGHGIPDEKTGTSYLLPVDGYGSNTATGYKLSTLYEQLSSSKAASSIVLLDACFSGVQRTGDILVAARGIAIKTKPEAPKGNMVVFSAAQGDQTAYSYDEKGHGMFTYYLLKKLQESGGEATLGEIAGFVTENVSKRSIVENSKSQTPSVSASPSLSASWKSLKLAE